MTAIPLHSGLRFNGIQTCRGIAAVLIVVHHVGFNNLFAFASGDFAVSLFLILSGFLTCLHHLPHASSLDGKWFRKWYSKKLLNIYPLYFLTMVFMFAWHRFSAGVPTMIVDLLMIQSWFPMVGVYWGGNSPLWFISDLFFCYLITLPVLKLISAHGNKLLGIIGICFIILYFIILLILPTDKVFYVTYINPIMQFPAFSLGIAAGYFYLNNRNADSRFRHPIFMLFLALAIIILTMWSYDFVPQRFRLSCLWWIPSLFLIYVVVRIEDTDSPHASMAKQIICSRAGVTLGSLSMPIYMLHFPLLLVMRSLLSRHDIILSQTLQLLILLPIVIVASAAWRALRLGK